MAHGSGIKLSAGFDANIQGPLDTRTEQPDLKALQALEAVCLYEGIEVFVLSEKKYYTYIDKVWIPRPSGEGTGVTDNNFTDEYKAILDNLAIPTVVSALENDAGYITKEGVPIDTVFSSERPQDESISLWFEPVSAGSPLPEGENVQMHSNILPIREDNEVTELRKEVQELKAMIESYITK